jgi:hypothetical protein
MLAGRTHRALKSSLENALNLFCTNVAQGGVRESRVRGFPEEGG